MLIKEKRGALAVTVVVQLLCSGPAVHGQSFVASSPQSAAAAQHAAVELGRDGTDAAGQAPEAKPAVGAANNVTPGTPLQINGSPSFLESPAKLSIEAISSFRTEPRSLLSNNPDGGFRLASETRSLVGSDVFLLSSLIELAKDASQPQMLSIAAGLAQLVRMAATTRPDIALYIQQQLLLADNPALLAAFNASLGDVQTAAFAAAASGPAAAAGGIGGGANAAGSSALSSGIPGAGAPTIARVGTSSSFFSSSTTSSTTLGITSVSPTVP